LKHLTIEALLQSGLHDAELVEVNLDFGQKEAAIKVFENSNTIIFKLSGVKSLKGLGYDGLNKIFILDYEITRKRMKLFTTMSEWLEINFENMSICLVE
jgi:hypothetical protein